MAKIVTKSGKEYYLSYALYPEIFKKRPVGDLLIGNSITYLANFYLQKAIDNAKDELDTCKADVAYKSEEQTKKAEVMLLTLEGIADT